ncbi:helix-turn-helix domain-containing protein [Leclercia adecarboxylata]|uniref:helix-turn-helix domain-containing protein n=1 Tax=Leclercia adecarboxylata TaxID=83655 RepID=UPI003AF32493
MGVASSSHANRYKRDFFPSDIVVRCMAETGATLEWLALGYRNKFDGESDDLIRIPMYKLVDGQLYELGP